MDLSAQVFPQVVGQADFTILTVPSTTALRGIHRFVDGVDNLGDENRISASPQLVTAARTAHANDQGALPEFGEQLFQVRLRNRLSLGNLSQAHGPLLIVQRQVQHRRDRVSAFGG